MVVWRCRRLTSCPSPLGGRFRIAGAPALAILWPRFPVPAVLVAWRCRCRIAGAPAFAMLWLWFSVPAVLAVWRCSCGIAGAPALPILWPSFGTCNLGCLEMLLSRRHSGTPGLPRTGKCLLTEVPRCMHPGCPARVHSKSVGQTVHRVCRHSSLNGRHRVYAPAQAAEGGTSLRTLHLGLGSPLAQAPPALIEELPRGSCPREIIDQPRRPVLLSMVPERAGRGLAKCSAKAVKRGFKCCSWGGVGPGIIHFEPLPCPT